MATVTKTIGTATHQALTGTLDAANAGASTINGTGTQFTSELTTSNRLIINHATAGWHSYDITAINSDTQLTIAGGLVEAISGGTTGYKEGTLRDYSTITLWEADDGGGDGLGNDDCIGKCYDDSTFDEAVTIDFSANSITLTVPEGERHDGTRETGATINRSSNVTSIISINTTVVVTIEWLEITFSGPNYVISAIKRDAPVDGITVRNNLIYDLFKDQAGTNPVVVHFEGDYADAYILNNMVFNCESSTDSIVGISVFDRTVDTSQVLNNTVHNIHTDGGTLDASGIQGYTSERSTIFKNNIVTDTSATGTAKDFNYGADHVASNNLSSDDTADDIDPTANHLINKSSSNQFVSTTGGSEDLHLKSGADAIDAGTDLGTTPSGVNIDIDGRDRDAQGDVWDMGADEYVSAAFGGSSRIIGAGVMA